jgi:hypothetical protein
VADIPALANYYKDVWTNYDKMGFSRIATPTARLLRDDGNLFLEGRQAHIVLPTTMDGPPTYDVTKTQDNPGIPDVWLLPGPIGVFGQIDIAGQVMARPNAAVIPVIDQRIAYNMQGFHEQREKRLWSDTTGALGQVGAITGTTTVTTPVDIDTFFSVPPNAIVVFNPNRTGNAGTIRACTYKVTGKLLNSDFTAQLTLTRLTGAVVPVLSDYIYIDGTYDAAPPGILSFLPATLPGPGDSFLGVDRSNYPNLLAGWRFDYEGTIKGTIIRAFSVYGRMVAPQLAAERVTVCVSGQDWARLIIEHEGQVRYYPESVRKFGTNAIVVETQHGPVPVITIPAIKDTDGLMYCIDWDSFHNAPVGTVPHIYQDDGLVFARIGYGSTAQDAVSMRLRAYDYMFCSRPVTNWVGKTK